ncbi:MAG: hypothetical protein IKO07_06325 [Clostridia bacterium]|nr:hypothetical protein [Clostridia bacterium]
MAGAFSSDQFFHVLQSKCPNPQPCPFCGSKQFSVIEEFCQLPVQTEPQTTIKIGTSVPCGVVVCTNCGHINLFALKALGLMREGGADKDA